VRSLVLSDETKGEFNVKEKHIGVNREPGTLIHHQGVICHSKQCPGLGKADWGCNPLMQWIYFMKTLLRERRFAVF